MAQQPPPPGTPDPSGDGQPTPVPLPPRYRFAAPLGEGGIGTVVKAYDTQLRTHVAIKTIRHDLATHNPLQYAHLRDRFEREAIAGARVRSSPYIVTVHDLVIDHANNAFLILEYIPGGTLADRLHPDGTRTAVVPLAVAEALRLTADAARGLQDLHDADLVHRDIKPENIFIAANGWAKVGDLGIVQMSTTTFRTRMEYGSDRGHPGTPMYMSPEQANTGDVLTPEADQYSLGCVLFEVVTGKRFKGIHAPECERLLRGQPVGVAGLIRQMTAAEAAERYEGMGAVLAAIAAIDLTVPPEPVAPDPRPAPIVTIPAVTVPRPLVNLHQTPHVDLQPAAPVVARRPPPSPVPPRPVSRRAVLAGIGGVVVAGGTVGGVWAIGHKSGTNATTIPVPTAAAAAVVANLSSPLPSSPSIPATASSGLVLPTPILVSPTPTTVPPTATPRSVAVGGTPDMVQFKNGTADISAYEAGPSISTSPLSAVIILHDDTGLTEHIKDVTRRLAKEGFLGFTLDLLSREGGIRAFNTPQDATAAINKVSDEQMISDVNAAIMYLTGSAVGAPRVGILGFGVGGRWTLVAAEKARGLSAASVYYGSPTGGDNALRSIDPIKEAASLTCPLMGNYGAIDPAIPVGSVQKLADAAKGAGKPLDFRIFETAGHAFNNDTRPFANGIGYVPASAQDAWARTLNWFKRYLTS